VDLHTGRSRGNIHTRGWWGDRVSILQMLTVTAYPCMCTLAKRELCPLQLVLGRADTLSRLVETGSMVSTPRDCRSRRVVDVPRALLSGPAAT